MLAGGGFDDGPRAAFAGLAGVALLLALGANRELAVRISVAPAVVALLTLAALSGLSAGWTEGEPDSALRWGLVIAGYASIAIAGGVMFTARPSAVSASLAGLALITGALGLVGAGLGIESYAERLGGSWRPAGSFEYPPALALVQVAALPILIERMIRAGSDVGAATWALFASVPVVVIATSQSRVAAVLAAGSLLFVAVQARGRRSRRLLLASLIWVLIVALVAYWIAAGLAEPGDRGPARLVEVGLLLVAAAVAWPPVRRWGRGSPGADAEAARSLISGRAAVALVMLVAVLVAAALGLREGGGIERNSGFAHGREAQWGAAIEVATEHPLLGAGAEAYFVASADEQGRFPVLYAHSLPLEVAAELGIVGVLVLLALALGIARAVAGAGRDPALWTLVPAVLALPLASLLDWSWHLAGVGALWALALGALLASSHRGKRSFAFRPREAMDPPSQRDILVRSPD